MEQFHYNILIIDDNPFPIRECVEVLLHKFKDQSNYLCILDDNSINQQFEKSGYDNIADNFESIRGKNLSFEICDNVCITLYNYDATKQKVVNQNAIIQLINSKKINILWTDRGHSPFNVEKGKIYAIDNDNSTNSDELFKNQTLVKALINNNIRQIAIYSFNPSLNQREVEKKRDKTADFFKEVKSLNYKEDIYFLETSSVLNIFEREDCLSGGQMMDRFLGTITAYKKYGNLLGNVLFDLFLQLKENRARLSTNENRYNFFNERNRSFLSYFKLLNNNGFIRDDFKIGNVSYYGEYRGEINYLIDVPYKEYYNKYDSLLFDDSEDKSAIVSVYELNDGELEGYIYYRYQKNSKNHFDFCYEHRNISNPNIEHLSKLLPLLHTAIFYEPDFYEKRKYSTYPFGNFSFFSDSIITNEIKDQCEIFYLIKKTNFDDIPGLLHLSFWRRKFTDIDDIVTQVEEFWKMYYPLVEAKVEETLLPLLMLDISNQSKKAAIIQYMARNLSHNTGSHLIPEAIEYFKQYLKNDTGEKETLELKEKFAYYQKYTQERMELLAQLSSMRINHNWTNYSFNEIIDEFEKSIVPKGLCDDLNKNQKAINISIKDNITNVFVALPDGAVGKQAFYVILENFIRNAYKHSTPKDNDGQNQYEFEIKISEASLDLGVGEFWCFDMYDKLGSVVENTAKRTSEMLTDLKYLIESSVLTNGQLRERGWGILEMKSAAAFLSGQPLELLDELSSKYFEANFYDNEGCIEENPVIKNIGHRFYLPKPKLLIIDKSIATDSQKQDESRLKTKGIIISEIDFDTVKKMPHLFIITKLILGFSNQKILKENIDTTKDLATVENALWEQYLFEKKWNSTIIAAANNGLNNDIKITAFFDSHGKVLTLYNEGNLKDADKRKIDSLGLFYYHPFKSRSKIQELTKGLSEHRFKGLLLEGVFTKVLIIDERVQNAANSMDNDQPNLSVKDIFSLIGVDIPSQNLSDYLEKPDKAISSELLGLIKNNKYKYVILHLSILEKMAGTSNKEELRAFIDDGNGIDEKICFDNNNRAFVLVSGRGQPPNLPASTYYINYTTLYDCLMYRMSKPHLMQTLLTLRK